MLALSCFKYGLVRQSNSTAAYRMLIPMYRTMGTFGQSTLSPPKEEELKFSAFLKSDKKYTVPKQD